MKSEQEVEEENEGKQSALSIERLALEWIAGAGANGFSSAVLNPLDVSKTRMQATESKRGKGGQAPRLVTTLRSLYLEGGLIGLWKPGLSASLCREFLYSGPRAGFYVHLRNYFTQTFQFQSELPSKVLAALTTGMFNRGMC